MRDTGQPLRVLFVCGLDFTVASEKQALWFAEELLRKGHAAAISIGGDLASAATEGVAEDAGLEVLRHRFIGRRMRRADVDAARAFAPNVIHAFNPRVAVVAAAARYRQATRARVFVHWEDDEWTIRDDPMTSSLYRRAGRRARRVVAALYPPQGHFASRASLRWTTSHAAGFDALTPALADAVRDRTGRPCRVVLPVHPPTVDGRFAAPAPELPAAIEGTEIALLTGTVHKASEPDLRIALRAVAEVQKRGRPLSFVHAGDVLPRFKADELAAAAGLRPSSAAFLGYVPFARIPALLAKATVLLQPGAPTDFNRLRLPSKLLAYLASGTPTITFAAGFGELLADRDEVLKTHTGEPGELADRIDEVLTDPALRARLRDGGRAAGARLFDADRNVDELIAYYREGLAG